MVTVSSQVSKYMGNAVTVSNMWGGIIINVKASPYLAKGDGVTDDTVAIQAAVNAAIALNGSQIIFFPPGTYKLTTLPAITKNHIYFMGTGAGVTILSLSTGTCFTWGDGVNLIEEGGISDMTISYATASPLSPTVLTKYASGQKYRNLKLFNVCTFLECGVLVGDIKTYSQRFTNVSVAVANAGKPLIKLVNGAGFYWEDGSGGFVSGVLPPVGAADMTTVADTDFVRIEGNWDTVRLNNFIERFYRGVYAKADVGKTILNIKIFNSLYDYIRLKSVDIFANGGTVSGVEINGSKLNSWEDHCVHVHSTGFCQGIDIDNLIVGFAGGSGVQFDGNPGSFKVNNSKIKGCVRKVVGDGIVIGSTLNDFSLENNDVGGDVSSSGITWGAAIGISLQGTNENYSMRGNRSYRFSVTNPANSLAANAKKNRQCKDNIWTGNEPAYNYAGLKTTGIFVLPATATGWWNTTPYDVEVMWFGGTMTGAEKELANVGFSSNSFVLRPGEYFVLYYNVAPNISFFVKQ